MIFSIEYCLTSIYFSYSNIFYKQIKEAVMEFSIFPMITNNYMELLFYLK